MKLALCFLISGDHILNKEHIWIKWIEEFGKHNVNVYFHYKDYNKIKSEWIQNHAIPPKYIVPTSYFHVVPAYISILQFALNHDQQNQWFCMLTDSCVPIISPLKCREMFLSNYNYSIFNWKKPWWNMQLCKRANLHLLPPDLQLGHDPWFVLKRQDVRYIMTWSSSPHTRQIYNTVCSGGLANESIFAVIFYLMGLLGRDYMLQYTTHLTDWTRADSSTSPHVFKLEDEDNDGKKQQEDILVICEQLSQNKYAMFLRKVAPSFPDSILEEIIYTDFNKERRREKVWMMELKMQLYLFLMKNKYCQAGYVGIGLFCVYMFFKYF